MVWGAILLLQFFGMMRSLDSENPIARFKFWLERSRHVRAPTPTSCSAGPSPAASDYSRLLSSHLPLSPVGVSAPNDPRARRSWLLRRSAWDIVEWLVACYGYYELSCPKSTVQYVDRLGPWQVTQAQEEAIGRLYEDVLRFCRVHASSIWSRGRKTLADAIRQVELDNQSGALAAPLAAAAKEVVPERVSLPSRAGILDPIHHLPPERVQVLRDMRKLELDRSDWPDYLVKPCHWISRENEHVLRLRMLECDMAEIVEAASVPMDHTGRRISAGLFSVPHKEHSDRLIIDRRAANSVEDRLKWCTLPHGSLFTQVYLGPNEMIRGSGDDLSNCFYLLAYPPLVHT